MKTLLLDRTPWDLCIDAAGNIAVASAPYSIVQDVASACRLFLGELYYDTTKGVPYWQDIIAKTPPLSLVRARIEAAARTVPGVASAVADIAVNSARTVTGSVLITTTDGQTQTVAI